MQSIVIQETEIQIKEYQGKRVVTFKDIDKVHQRPEGTARKRFNDNRKHFIAGEDFFKISPSEFRTAFQLNMDTRQQNDITLITESGYLMLAKSFTDNLAWKVQRGLVNGYFRFEEIEECFVVPVDACLEAAKIMASVPDSQKYVVNILKHYFPDIDAGVSHMAPDNVAVDIPEKEKPVNAAECSGDYAFPFNHNMLDNYLLQNNISRASLQDMLGCSDGLVTKWCNGLCRPTRSYRVKICEVLGLPIGYFDNTRRCRRMRK